MGKKNNKKEDLLKDEEKYEPAAVWGEDKDAKTLKEYDISDQVKERMKDLSKNVDRINQQEKIDSKLAVELVPKIKDYKVKKNFLISSHVVMMVNELRALHPNVNIRFSVIVENAIKHYYKYIKEEGGRQEGK